MENNQGKSISEFMAGDRAARSDSARRGAWEAFVSSEVVRFFDANMLVKLAIEDENGNKAKITRMKDDKIKVECSSVEIY